MAFGSIENIIADRVGQDIAEGIGNLGVAMGMRHVDRAVQQQKDEAFNRVLKAAEEWKAEAVDNFGGMWHQYFRRIAAERLLHEIFATSSDMQEMTSEKMDRILEAYYAEEKSKYPKEAKAAEEWIRRQTEKNN